MEVKYIKIKGMTCTNCQNKVTKALIKITNVKSVNVNLNTGIAEIKYQKHISNEDIVNAIKEIGYHTNLSLISDHKNKLNNSYKLIELALLFTIIIAVYFFIKNTTGFDFLSVIPNIDSNVSLLMLFVIGLITSLHCIGMCGGILLAASISGHKSYKNPLMYNLGRITSYTVLGGLFGLLGSFFKINSFAYFIIISIASILMLIMGLSMLGLIPFKLTLKLPKLKYKPRSPYIIGLLNGFMPCGALQSMQLYAVSTGSFILGALSMFLFVLGTVPLMLVIGLLFNYFKDKSFILIQKIGALLIIILSIIMFNRALTYIGIDLTKLNFKDYSHYQLATIKDNYQEIVIYVKADSYQDIVVQKGIKVRLNFKAESFYLTGCNNKVILPEWDIEKDLHAGDNIVEFTPQKTGDFLYTCWMNMIKNHIVVVDDINQIKK